MSEQPPTQSHELSTVTCPTCGDTVPTGVYCGACGHHLSLHQDDAKSGFRSHSYAAAPSEHVLRLSVVTSLFPHLPHRSRTPFRIAVAVIVIALVVLAALRLQAPMIAVACLGVPLLVQLYLQESDVYEDLPVPLLALSVLLGAGLGVGFAFLTRDRVRDSIAASVLGAGTSEHLWLDGVLFPIIAGALLVVPAIVCYFVKPPHVDESLDGFLIGSIGAVGYTAADTITRLAPQLKSGVIAHDRGVGSIVVEALLQGVAVPLTGACVGGVVGAALWVRRRSQVHFGRWLATARLMIPVALLIYLALGLIDYYQPPQTTLLVLHLVVAVIALIALRYGLHAVLIHEEHAVAIGPPRVCPHCEQVVPSMPFCPHCGFAARAASRSARTRLDLGPDEASPEPGGGASAPLPEGGAS
jgi:RsiW-degrading membrane proteinase PrsW (M82 family)